KWSETEKIIENSTRCKDNRRRCDFDEFHEIINEMENHLAKLEKEKDEQKKDDIIRELNEELIYIDKRLNKWILCEDCKEKKLKMNLNELFNILNEIINKESYFMTVRNTRLPNMLLETLKLIESCASCKDNGGKCDLEEFHKTTNAIGYRLAMLEKEKEEHKKDDVIRELNEQLIFIYKELNKRILCEDCKEKKL